MRGGDIGPIRRITEYPDPLPIEEPVEPIEIPEPELEPEREPEKVPV